MIAMVVTIAEHQAIGKDTADDHVPGFLVGENLARIHETQAVRVGAKQMHNPHFANLLHHRIAILSAQFLTMLKGAVVAAFYVAHGLQEPSLDSCEVNLIGVVANGVKSLSPSRST